MGREKWSLILLRGEKCGQDLEVRKMNIIVSSVTTDETPPMIVPENCLPPAIDVCVEVENYSTVSSVEDVYYMHPGFFKCITRPKFSLSPGVIGSWTFSADPKIVSDALGDSTKWRLVIDGRTITPNNIIYKHRILDSEPVLFLSESIRFGKPQRVAISSLGFRYTDPRQRILYIHGLKGGPNGRKNSILKTVYDVQCPQMTGWFVPYDMYIQAKKIIEFQPEAIVASSYGTIIARMLQWADLWNGGVVALSSALSGLAPPNQWIYVHGSRDAVCRLPEGVPISVDFAVGSCTIVNDGHALRELSIDTLRTCISAASNRERSIRSMCSIKIAGLACLATGWLGWRKLIHTVRCG